MTNRRYPREALQAAHEAADEGTKRVLNAISKWQGELFQDELEQATKGLLLEIILDAGARADRPHPEARRAERAG